MRDIKIHLISLLFLLIIHNQAHSQGCGTQITEEQLRFIEQIYPMKNLPFARTQFSIVKIPIKIHSVRLTSGSGGFAPGQLSSLLDKVNNYYANAGIEFFQFGEVNIVDNDSYYNLNSANEGGLAVPNDVANVINVYFMNTLITNGQPLCGYTRFPPSSDRVFTTYSCALNGVTLEHELGHYFTLFHSHGTTNNGTTDELVNGSNCQDAGDRICDTPADPNLDGKVNSSCVYIGTNRDANGQAYSPMVSNIMSYAGVCRNLFTSGQYERIRNGFENGRSYLLTQSDDFNANIFTENRQTCKGGVINFLATGSGASSWSWEFQGGTPAVSTEKAPKIKYSSGGVYPVKLTARASNGQSVIVEKTGFIIVSDPLEIAFKGDLSYQFDSSLPPEFTLNNPDQSFTFGFSNFDRSGGSSGSIYVNNFNYASDRFINYDQLISPFLDNKGVKRYQLSFDVSYASRQGGFDGVNIRPDAFDSLSLSVYNQCGKPPKQIWKQGGISLQTAPIQSTEFFPIVSQWKNVSLIIDVNEEEFTQVNWTNTSVNGNNLFIDNISIKPDYSLNSPSNFRASNISSSGITLRWSDNSANELGFVIERSKNGGGFTELTKIPKNQISFIDSDLENGINYKYRMYAFGIQAFKSDLTPEITIAYSITAIEDFSLQVNFYPNPFINELKVENNSDEQFSFRIFSTLGVQVFEFDLASKSSNKYLLDQLNPGVYLVQAKSKNKIRSLKIIKL